jgi:hypothetical protein
MREVDAATRALYERLIESPHHGPVIAAIERAVVPERGHPAFRDLAIVLVPGILYRDYPETGADGAVLAEVAAELGLPFERIDSDGCLGLQAGAQLVLEHLRRRRGRCVLFSLSKGTTEVVAALRSTDAVHAFANVAAWVSVSGIPFGTPVFEQTLARPLGRAYLGAACLWKGWSFAALRDVLQVRDATVPVPVPDHLSVVQVAAFPRAGDLQDRRSRRFHRRLAPNGPNDGFVLLEQLQSLPGYIYPLWGADHYLRRDPPLDLADLLRRCLACIATGLLANRPLREPSRLGLRPT